jgi:hypothetical protein
LHIVPQQSGETDTCLGQLLFDRSDGAVTIPGIQPV